MTTTERIMITADNIDQVRESCTAQDQAKELAVGDETWGITYEGGQRGQMSRFAESGRGAVCFGGDSVWGDWNGDVLVGDDGERYSESGELINA